MSLLNNASSNAGMNIPKARLVFPTQSTADKYLVGNILNPLLPHHGIVFDYTPIINLTQSASYSPVSIPHSNYEYRAYSHSTVQEMQLNVEFTANTRNEANKLLAVIHFLRTFTKMNFGINDPEAGIPPQILRFSAYGPYAFNRLPVAIQSFSLPWGSDVDMVMTSHGTAVPAYMSGNISLALMPTPNKVRSEFTLDSFARGDTVRKGYV